MLNTFKRYIPYLSFLMGLLGLVSGGVMFTLEHNFLFDPKVPDAVHGMTEAYMIRGHLLRYVPHWQAVIGRTAHIALPGFLVLFGACLFLQQRHRDQEFWKSQEEDQEQ